MDVSFYSAIRIGKEGMKTTCDSNKSTVIVALMMFKWAFLHRLIKVLDVKKRLVDQIFAIKSFVAYNHLIYFLLNYLITSFTIMRNCF